jgi:hypothetical protein
VPSWRSSYHVLPFLAGVYRLGGCQDSGLLLLKCHVIAATTNKDILWSFDAPINWLDDISAFCDDRTKHASNIQCYGIGSSMWLFRKPLRRHTGRGYGNVWLVYWEAVSSIHLGQSPYPDSTADRCQNHRMDAGRKFASLATDARRKKED